MFLKLTKLDGSPVWINASFVVTVEPAHGGSLVVPAGDGFDYDVREKPEDIVAMLEGAPAAAILPVPAPESAEASAPAPMPPPAAVADTAAKKAKKTAAKKAAAEKKKKEKAVEDALPEKKQPEPEEETPKKTVRKKQSSPSSSSPSPAAPLSEDQLERLRKLMPGRIPALNNTLDKQFGVAPAYADETREWLVKEGVIAMVGNRIAWL